MSFDPHRIIFVCSISVAIVIARSGFMYAGWGLASAFIGMWIYDTWLKDYIN